MADVDTNYAELARQMMDRADATLAAAVMQRADSQPVAERFAEPAVPAAPVPRTWEGFRWERDRHPGGNDAIEKKPRVTFDRNLVLPETPEAKWSADSAFRCAASVNSRN